MGNAKEFGAVDYVIFALLLGVSAAIGIFFGFIRKKQNTSKELLLGNRAMGVFPSSLSLLASFMSGITILGNPAEVYNYGTLFWWSGIAYTLVTIVTANIFIPLFLSLDVTSAYEYLEKRFNRYVKLMASCIFTLQMTIYMSLVLYAPALALYEVTGLNTWISVASIAVVCTFYTTIGGMKAVMWTDVFQIIIMLIGLLSSLIKGTMDVGGVRKVIETNWKYDRIEFFVFDANPTIRHTVWGLTLGSFFQWLSIYGVNQSQVQRYLSMPSAKKAKKAIYWNLFGLWIILSLTLSIGLVIFAKYQSCDPIISKRIETSEQLFPLFVMETLNNTPGLPGLFLACLFSAALSTISSGLNSLAAVVLEDIIKSFIVKDMSVKKEVLYSKILCICFGVICLALTVAVQYLGTLLQAALSLFGVIGGPVLGLFCLGIFVPFANPKGAIVGTLTSLSFLLWIFIGFNAYGIKYTKKPFYTYGCENPRSNKILYLENYFRRSYYHNKQAETTTVEAIINNIEPYTGIKAFHSISYTWYGFLAVSIVLIVGSIVSLLTGRQKPGETDPKYIITIFDKIFPFLPNKVLKYLNCGFGADTNKVADSSIIENQIELKEVENKPETVETENQNVTDLTLNLAQQQKPETYQPLQSNNPIITEV